MRYRFWLRTLSSGALVGTELFVAHHAAAETAARALRIAYTADAECPDRAAFFAKVRERAPQVQIVEDDRGLPDFSVTLETRRGRSVGRLEERRSDGTTTVRELQGDSCETVASAQALATALAIHAESRAISGDHGDTSTDESASPQLASPRPSDPQPATKSAAEPDRPAGLPVRWSFGLAGDFVGAVLPGWSAAGSMFVEATRVESTRPMSVRLSVVRIFPRSRGFDWGDMSVDSILGGLQVCPLRWPLRGASLGLRPCAGIEIGSIAATGTVSEHGGQSGGDRRVWVDAGVGLRAEWALDATWRLELRLAAVFPMTQYTFAVAPTAVYEIPPVAASAGIGVAASFP